MSWEKKEQLKVAKRYLKGDFKVICVDVLIAKCGIGCVEGLDISS